MRGPRGDWMQIQKPHLRRRPGLRKRDFGPGPVRVTSVGMKHALWIIVLGAALAWAQAGQAQGTQPRPLGCLPPGEVAPDHTARELAGAVRACVAREDYAGAVQMFFVYSTVGLFDQQRVADESGHVALQELHAWVFTGYSYAQMNALRAELAGFRTREGALFEDTCAALAAMPPPTYRPDYMLRVAQVPLRHPDDWITQGFDADAAWRRARVEVNGCRQ